MVYSVPVGRWSLLIEQTAEWKGTSLSENEKNGSADQKSVLRETDDDARRLAKTLIRSARFAALASVPEDTGHPMASRVAMATDLDGTPLILVSTLSGHTSAIVSNPNCSLLVGEPGKGDPLAHPRATLFCTAKLLERGSHEQAAARSRYLSRHPKAELYADFGDFRFFRLELTGASLNGGFGKAYELSPSDLIASIADPGPWSEVEKRSVAHMNEDHLDAIKLYAEVLCQEQPGNWKIATLDPEGLDLVAGDRIARLWFDTPLASPSEIRETLVALAMKARNAD